MQERRSTRPATAADFHRLADLGKERGLRLFRDGTRWYCSSASQPGACQYVTGFSCDCPGFIAHQRCTHHALLLDYLGWLPELEDEAPAAQRCSACSGAGKVEEWGVSGPIGCKPCDSCGGSGVRQDRRLQDAPPVQPAAAA
jgi:hypothetical protein